MIFSARACFLAACLSIGSILTPAQNAKVSSVLDMSEFVHDWQISRQFTIDVANATPADLYSFSPNPKAMISGEQMVHIAVLTNDAAQSR